MFKTYIAAKILKRQNFIGIKKKIKSPEIMQIEMDFILLNRS